MKERLVIVGAGGHGRVCADVAASQGFEVCGFVDARLAGSGVNGLPVLAADLAALAAACPPASASVFVAVGDNAVRMALLREAAQLGYRTPGLCHPTAWISPSARVGDASVLMPGVILNANTVIGNGCIINTAATLDHDNLAEDGAQICPGVRAAGNVFFGTGAFVGTGAVLIPGVRVGREAVVGAGSVVIRDVPDAARVAGNPARPIGGPASASAAAPKGVPAAAPPSGSGDGRR